MLFRVFPYFCTVINFIFAPYRLYSNTLGDVNETINEKQEVHNMKKFFFVSMLFCMISSAVFAQDDMYFVPKKSSKEIKQEPKSVTYSGSSRDVDEYNRYGLNSTYYSLDSVSTANDVFNFEQEAYADSLLMYEDGNQYDTENDYICSRIMNRFDDFYWYDPWYCGWYYPGYWYGSPYWYARYGWYDPWFYGWYGPWTYYSWYYPSYWHGSYYRPYRGITGTSNHGRVNYGYAANNNRNFSGYRGSNNRGNSNNRYNTNQNNYNNNFRGNRNNNYSNNNVQSRPSFNSGSNFGSGRSGGFGGGGSFGGGSRGGSFGGRR